MIFVYNTDSGFFNQLRDGLHKFFSSKTYPCNLCRITYGGLSMDDKWKGYLSELDDYEVKFMHKNEFVKEYSPEKTGFPAVFVNEKNGLRFLISDVDINKCVSVDAWIKLVSKRLSAIHK